MTNKKIRLLIVDDSALVRQILSEGLGEDPAIEVIGTAQNPYEARDMIVRLSPDVLTLDIEMPRMDGVEFLSKLMPQMPIPVVLVSALAKRGADVTLRGLEAGAVDFVTKPSSNVLGGLKGMMQELRTKVKIAATANVAHYKNRSIPLKPIQTSLSQSTDKVIGIGASTGGTEATKVVLKQLPPSAPGIVVVQHMPSNFTSLYAERLNADCRQQCVEAQDGDRIIQGKVYIAPGDKHLKVVRSGGQYLIKIYDGDKVSGHRPSVDVFMQSMAESVGANAVGVMLTGMGSDGASGMLAMKNAGARTMAQDEESSVVWGMPAAAMKNGGAEACHPLTEIASHIVEHLTRMEAA